MRTSRVTAIAALFAGSALLASPAFAQSEKLRELPPNLAPNDKTLKWGDCPEGLPKGCQLAVLNGDPAKPGADVFLKLPPKSKVPPHKHTSVERIVMVEGDMTLTYDGHAPLAVRRGTYHYGPAGAVHEAACVSTEPCVLFISFEKPVDLIQMPLPGSSAAGKPAASSGTAPGTTEKKPKKGGC